MLYCTLVLFITSPGLKAFLIDYLSTVCLCTCICKLFTGFTKTTVPISTKLNWHKVYLGKAVSSLFKCRAISLSKGDNTLIVKIYWQILKILLFKPLGQVQSNVVQGFKFVWMKGHGLYQGNIIAKIYWWHLKISLRITGPISIKLGTMHSSVKGNQICWKMKDYALFKGNSEIAKVHWQNLKILFKSKATPSSKGDNSTF